MHVLGCPVRFNQADNGVVFARSELGLGLVQVGRELHAHLRQLANDMLASLAQDSVSARCSSSSASTRAGARAYRRRTGHERAPPEPQTGRGGFLQGLREALLFDMAQQNLKQGQGVSAVAQEWGSRTRTPLRGRFDAGADRRRRNLHVARLVP